MLKIFLFNCVFVLLLLTNDITKIFYYAENKSLNNMCIYDTAFRAKIKLNKTIKLKSTIKRYTFIDLKKKERKEYNKIECIINRNKIRKKFYMIYLDKYNINIKLRKIIELKNYEINHNANSKNKANINFTLFFNIFESLDHKNNLNKNEVKKKLILKKKLFLKKEDFLKFSRLFFINIYIKYRKYRKKNRKKFKTYLKKYEELYQRFTPEQDEEDNEGILKLGGHTISNIIINEWCLGDNKKKYNLTLMYDYISNMHNSEFQNEKSINNLIKNNELIEKEEYRQKNKSYLTYKYQFKYLNPISKKSDFYEYEYCIPKLITYEEDISTESKYAPPNLPKCYKYSPINFLTTSGYSSRNIDTFGKERNKIYSFNTPTDVKRNIYFNDLMLISSSYNQHFFSNLNFLLNLHTLQILIRDKTAIETDFIIDKFDQLKEKLIELSLINSKKNKTALKNGNLMNSENKNKNNISCTNSDSCKLLFEANTKSSEIENNQKEGEIIKKEPLLINKDDNEIKNYQENDSNTMKQNEKKKKENEQNYNIDNNTDNNIDNGLDEELAQHLTYKKSLFDEKIQVFKKKYDSNILEDKEFINLWKYNENGEIIEELGKIPIPKIYLNIDDPKFCLWKILQNSGKTAFKEIPTPNRKLEAWRQQVNLKEFYKQNFDTSISIRHISKEELANFKIRILDNSDKKNENFKRDQKENGEKLSDKNYIVTSDIKKNKDNINLHHINDINPENHNYEGTNEKIITGKNYETNEKISKVDQYDLKKELYSKIRVEKESTNSNYNEENVINNCKNRYKNAFYTLVVRDGIVDEYLSDDINILKKLNKELKESTKNETEGEHASDEKNKSKIFIGSFFNVKDAEVEYLINKELYFIPEYSNWHKKNTQPFIRGQIGKQSRKFDNDYPIYDYRKSDFGMAKFSSLNLASIKDCAVIYLDKNIDLGDKIIHVIFISTSKNEDNNINEEKPQYKVFENSPLNGEQNISKDNEKNDEKDIPQNKKEQINNEKIKIRKKCDEYNTTIDYNNLIENIETKKLENENKKDKYVEKELKEYMHKPITNPRVVVYVKSNSKINIYESHISLNKDNGGLVNAFSRICLEEKSKVQHTLSQELGKNVWYFHNISVKNGCNANYKFVDVLLGSLSSRVNLQIEGEKGCKQESYGLALLDDNQNISQYEMFHHEYPSMETNQLFKYLVSDKAHAVWRSRGRIERNAIRAKLNTLCRTILLNFGASAVSIPTLEIIPSDIECANHGATISDLEKEPIFVLMTRGITEKYAREIMMKSYVNEIIEHISDQNLKERIYQKLRKISHKHNAHS